MRVAVIQRQYDEVIAPHYDLDSQSVLAGIYQRSLRQIERLGLERKLEPLNVLDLGLGTGAFCERLRSDLGLDVQPYGLDISAKMVDAARARIPNLVAEVDDAANVDAHFRDREFDLVCTHLLTGFVPIGDLAPKLWNKLADGGHWSFVGALQSAYPALQAKANNGALRLLLGAPKKASLGAMSCTPADRGEVHRVLEGNGFEIVEAQPFQPELVFGNFTEFMDYAYRGSWLTPYVEELGLHRAPFAVRGILNRLVFPLRDHHHLEILLARKVAGRRGVGPGFEQPNCEQPGCERPGVLQEVKGAA